MNHVFYISTLSCVVFLFQVGSSKTSVLPAHPVENIEQSASKPRYLRFHSTSIRFHTNAQDMNKNIPENDETKSHIDLSRRALRRGINAIELVNHMGRKQHNLAKVSSYEINAPAKASHPMNFLQLSRNVHMTGRQDNVNMPRNGEVNVHTLTENAHLASKVEENARMIGGAKENAHLTGRIEETTHLVGNGEENEHLTGVIQENVFLTGSTEENAQLTENVQENVNIAERVADSRGFSFPPDENFTNESNPLVLERIKRSEVCHGPRCNICPWTNEIQTDASRLPFRVMTRVCSTPSPVGPRLEHLVCSPLRVNMPFRLRHCSETATGSCVVMAPVTVGCYAAYRLNSDVSHS